MTLSSFSSSYLFERFYENVHAGSFRAQITYPNYGFQVTAIANKTSNV